jgi:hypothetical protein
VGTLAIISYFAEIQDPKSSDKKIYYDIKDKQVWLKSL